MCARRPRLRHATERSRLSPLSVWPACWGLACGCAARCPRRTRASRLRFALLLTHRHCGGDGFPGCGAVLDVLGDHSTACSRSGLLARRAPLLEQAWVRVARGLGPRAGLSPSSGWPTLLRQASVRRMRRFDLAPYGATRLGKKRKGKALCCDATLVAPLRRRRSHCGTASPQGGAAPELRRPGPQRLVVLACGQVGGVRLG